MSSVIAPTILANTPEDFRSQVEKIHPFAKRVHIDITDGEFAQNLTIPLNKVWWPREWTVDIHMMVSRPSEYLEMIIRMNPNMVIFHSEVEEDLVPIFEKLKKDTLIKPGLALLRSTVPETVADAIKSAEHILVFSGNLGEFGGRASMMQLEKIRLIKDINSNVEIGWDGGANLSNVLSLTQAGVDVVNVGSAISQAVEPAQVYSSMLAEIKRKGAI